MPPSSHSFSTTHFLRFSALRLVLGLTVRVTVRWGWVGVNSARYSAVGLGLTVPSIESLRSYVRLLRLPHIDVLKQR